MRLECEHPFQLRGAEEIRCEDGKWTSPPKCIDELPRNTEHLELKGGYILEHQLASAFLIGTRICICTNKKSESPLIQLLNCTVES